MKELAADRNNSVLVPGGLLAVVATHHSSKFCAIDGLSSADLDLTIERVLGSLKTAGVVSNEQASRLQAADAQFSGYFREIISEIPEISEVTGCNSYAIRRTAHALFGARLFCEFLEVVVPADVSYELRPTGSVDLIADLQQGFRRLVAATWRRFFPKGEVSLVADAAAQFWIACLDHSFPHQIKCAFIGVYRRSSRDQLQVLNHPIPEERGLRVKDNVGEYVSAAQKRFHDLHGEVEERDRGEIHLLFAELLELLAKLSLPSIVARYYESLVHEICSAFSEMDGRFSSRNARFVGFLNRQMDMACGRMEVRLGTESVPEVLQAFDELIGLRSAKEHARNLARLGQIQQLRKANGIPPVVVSYNLAFAGNPGTGITTVARLIGRLYRALDIVKGGHLVECDSSGLVAESEVHTANRVTAMVDRALDGVLLVTDAPALLSPQNDFGPEIISALLEALEAKRERLVIVFAGYADQVEDFIRSDTRLAHYFPRVIELPDYSPVELSEILFAMLRSNNLVFSPEVQRTAVEYFQSNETIDGKFAYNSQWVTRCFQSIVAAQANRLTESSEIDVNKLNVLQVADVRSIERVFARFPKEREHVNGHANGHVLPARGAVRVI